MKFSYSICGQYFDQLASGGLHPLPVGVEDAKAFRLRPL